MQHPVQNDQLERLHLRGKPLQPRQLGIAPIDRLPLMQALPRLPQRCDGFDSDHIKPERGKPGRITAGSRTDIQNPPRRGREERCNRCKQPGRRDRLKRFDQACGISRVSGQNRIARGHRTSSISKS